MPRTTSSETSRLAGFTITCGVVVGVFFVTVVAKSMPSHCVSKVYLLWRSSVDW